MDKFLNRHILPFFIPHAGCPHRCVFCHQTNISGYDRAPRREEIEQAIHAVSGPAPEIAFYGGSFTALSESEQEYYLQPAFTARQSGKIAGIRISTRPDYIDESILNRLQRYGVDTVELGAQSFSDAVLQQSGRGHDAASVFAAVGQLRAKGFAVGLQLLPGLPGDSRETALESAQAAVSLKPDFVRVYPALVVGDTPLADLYQKGLYEPLSLPAAVALCRDMQCLFGQADIPVIRFGLQPTAELERSLLAGPYHPAFGQLVQSAVYLAQARHLCRLYPNRHLLLVAAKELSTLLGQKRSNLGQLMLLDPHLIMQPAADLAKGDLAIADLADPRQKTVLTRKQFYEM